MTKSNLLVKALIHQAQTVPNRLSMVLIPNSGVEELVTAGELYADAVFAAQTLQANGITPGQIVILALPHSRSLIASFWGALYSGAIPSIFPYDVSITSNSVRLQQMVNLVSQATAGALITTPALVAKLIPVLSNSRCQVLGVQSHFESQPSTAPECLPSAVESPIAYIQHQWHYGTAQRRPTFPQCHYQLRSLVCEPAQHQP